MTAGAYEHSGVLVESVDEVLELQAVVQRLGADREPVEEPVQDHPTFRFQHLLPMAWGIQIIQIYEGTNQIQCIVMAKGLLG